VHWKELGSAFGQYVVPNILATIAIIIAYRSGKYRLKIVVGRPAMIIGDGGLPLGSGIDITVSNNGKALAHVRQVYLEAVDGTLRQPFHPTPLAPGLTQARELPPGGGHGVWRFDYQELRNRLHDQVRDTTPELRACVMVGVKTYRSRKRISVTPLGQNAAPTPPRRTRVLGWLKSWRRSYVFPSAYALPLEGEIAGDTIQLVIGRVGRGLPAPTQLILVVHRVNGRQDRVNEVDPIRLPRTWRRTKTIAVPVADDSLAAAGESLWWHARTEKGLGQGVSAMTRSEFNILLRQRESAVSVREDSAGGQ
jgi:hypothetical protein